MILPLYLAMTAAEFHSRNPLPPHPAWMACHFSPYGTGLSNFPKALPEDAMLIVNDRIPVSGHDSVLIIEQLQQIVSDNNIRSVLLDFQRPDCKETAGIAKAIVASLPCPVGISPHYARDLGCPIFLPLPSFPQLPGNCFIQEEREIWLEIDGGCTCLTVTEKGTSAEQLPFIDLSTPHTDSALCCHYRAEILQDCIRFYLQRTATDWNTFFEKLPPGRVTCAIGLYQQLQHI